MSFFNAFKSSIAFKSSAKIPLVGASQLEIEEYKNNELAIKKAYIKNILSFCFKEINKLSLLDALNNKNLCQKGFCVVKSSEFESFTSTQFLWNFTEEEFRYVVKCVRNFLQRLIQNKYETLLIKLTIKDFGHKASFSLTSNADSAHKKSISYDDAFSNSDDDKDNIDDESPKKKTRKISCYPSEIDDMVLYILNHHDFKIKL